MTELDPFERYDIRGKYPEQIDENFAEKLGKAYAKLVSDNGCGKVVVTRDTKKSSNVLKEGLVAGLVSSGIEVLDAGIGPTDYTALTGREHETFSVQVTSSHLPRENNGFKFMYPAGNSLTNDDLSEIRENFRKADFQNKEGSTIDIKDEAKENYIESAVDFLQSKGLKPEGKIYIETFGGAGGILLPEILDKLDIEFHVSNSSYDPPNPEKHQCSELESSVDSGEYSVGVAMDMDADRAMVYADNDWLGGDELFGIIASAFNPEKVVGSMNTSPKVADSFDGDFLETRVGDPFVLSRMVEEEAEFGGEPNYHYAFNEFVPYSSGTMTALVASSLKISELKQDLKQIETLKASISVEKSERALENIKHKLSSKNNFNEFEDGVKYISSGASVLIRSSGTSEKLRITVHSENVDRAETALQEAKDNIQ